MQATGATQCGHYGWVNPLVNTAGPSSQASGHVYDRIRLQNGLVQLSLRLYETLSDAVAV